MIYLGNQRIATNHIVTQGALHPDDWLLWNIANQDYSNTYSGRKVTIQNNYIEMERTAAGTTRGLYSLLTRLLKSSTYTDDKQVDIYNAGGYVSGITLASNATFDYTMVSDIADETSPLTFNFILGVVDPSTGTFVCGRNSGVTSSAKYASRSFSLDNGEFIEAVNTYGIMLVNFYQASGGTIGDITRIRWKITGLGG